MADLVIGVYFVSLTLLFMFGSSGFIMVYYYLKYRNKKMETPPELTEFPMVTIQLPMYNEKYVVHRLLEAVVRMKYPKDKLEFQVLDDSTDETTAFVAEEVERYRQLGHDIKLVHRTNRSGYKAGALKEGLLTAKGEFIGVFDADFVPNPDFLMRTMPYFLMEEKIGMVQTRWEHINVDYSLLTRAQAMSLDAHFVIEQNVRNKAGFFLNFNGTGGIWRKSCIEDAGNWQADTITEDLDLSYRAQLRGWKFRYLNDVTSPAELPSEINALKTQQFRWTKGAVETARKILPMVWKSNLPFNKKMASTLHLTGNVVFPFILLTGILNVPLIYIKHQGGYELYFGIMAVFVLAFLGSFLFYMYSQKAVYRDWQKRMLLFPLFMAGSMGFAVNNTRAVIEGVFKKKSEFVRTPKYSIVDKKDKWHGKHYVPVKLSFTVILEALLSIYCLFGVGSSIYYLEIAAVPFQLLYTMGFGFVGWLSIGQAFTARRLAVAARKQKLETEQVETITA